LSIIGSLSLTSCGCWTKTTNTLLASSSTRDLSMSDARILEKVSGRSRRARYSGGARTDHEDLGKGLDITDPWTGYCECLQFRKKLNDVLVSCPCTKPQVTEKQKRLLKKIGKVAAYTAITGGSRGALSLLLKRMEPKDTAKPKAPNEKAQSA
jgi:hypothetical protein